MNKVRIWVYDGVLASGVAGPIDVLMAANTLRARQERSAKPRQPLFAWSVESLDGKPVRTASGQMLDVDARLDPARSTDALILAAPFVDDVVRFLDERRAALQPLMAGLRRQHARGALVATFCTGSYLLAEAGLLDGRRATTHWSKAKEFAKRYPDVALRPAEILTEQDGVLCSGAVTSYLNLALRIVEKLAGEDLATRTARHLLIATNRISQTAYATPATERDAAHSDRLVERAQHWMQENVRRPARLADLARRLGTTERTLNRRFKQALGEAPLRYLQSLRIETAKTLLETRELSVDAVTVAVGYEDVSAFRQLFKRETGLSPHEYRRRFARVARVSR